MNIKKTIEKEKKELMNHLRQVKDSVYTPNTDNIVISNDQKIIILGEYISSIEKDFPNDKEFGNKIRSKCLKLRIKSSTTYTNKMFPGSTNL